MDKKLDLFVSILLIELVIKDFTVLASIILSSYMLSILILAIGEAVKGGKNEKKN